MSSEGRHGGDHDDDAHPEHEEHVNHEAWVIPYADLLTLLMAMFIAMFAVSNVDAQKFKQLAQGFNEALRTGTGNSATLIDLGGSGEKIFAAPVNVMAQRIVESAAQGAEAELDPSSKAAAAVRLKNLEQAVRTAEADAAAELEAVQSLISSQAGLNGMDGVLETKIDDRGLVITVVTDDVVFGSGSAELGTSGAAILQVVGTALATVDNPILVEGHTDNVPIGTATYPSNWELSSARAGAVLRYFEQRSALAARRLQSAGFADTRPIDSNDTDAGRARNRRVEVIVESDAEQTKIRILEEAADASTRLKRPDATS